MPIYNGKLYPAFVPQGRKKKIDGVWYYQLCVIGNHGVCATWVTAETKRKIAQITCKRRH